MKRTAITLGSILLLLGCAACGPKGSRGTASTTPTHFATPKEAADALVKACRAGDLKAVNGLLTGGGPPVFSTGDPARDAALCARFVAAADRMTRLDPWRDGAVLVVGVDEFPIPAPIVQDAQGWHFDAAEGEKEIRRRRVGENELTAIATCRAWAERGGDAPEARYGYAYRLTGSRQRPSLIAWPTEPGVTGVLTFQVARGGTVYEKNLGSDTTTVAATLQAGRDGTWVETWD